MLAALSLPESALTPVCGTVPPTPEDKECAINGKDNPGEIRNEANANSPQQTAAANDPTVSGQSTPYISVSVPPNRTRPIEWLQVIINATLAVAAIVAICIYGGELATMKGQLTAMQKQFPELLKSADAAKKSADIAADAERAYISVTMEKITNYDTDKPVLIFKVSNQGHSPAFDMRHQSGAGFCKVPFPGNTKDIFPDSGEVENDGTLSAESSTNLFNAMFLHAPTSKALPSGERICGFGKITYESLGKRHYTHFCYIAGETLPEYSTHCPVHNDAD